MCGFSSVAVITGGLCSTYGDDRGQLETGEWSELHDPALVVRGTAWLNVLIGVDGRYGEEGGVSRNGAVTG